MATATSSRRLLPALALAGVAALLAAGCGASSGGGTTPTTASHAATGPFAWLKASAPPSGWKIARLPSGKAALAYPPGWRAIESDPGTVSAALMGPHRRIRGYLNATPQGGRETLANWARFRPAHNHEEGDRAVQTLAAAAGLRFTQGTGSCVIDRYKTISDRYREIACIVRGTHATTVVVGAAEPSAWASLAPDLQRAVSSFST
ncbi:MAG TPA: hypothetical protein VN606_01555 [Thermoleophilaceae bacterium]|nr:hypothetical protein [Thermoleophilaceae bacterium]